MSYSQFILNCLSNGDGKLSLVAIAKLSFVLVFAFFILSSLHALYLHPLRKIPGPFWARCSNLWGRYQNFYGQKSHSIHAAHKRYGELVD